MIKDNGGEGMDSDDGFFWSEMTMRDNYGGGISQQSRDVLQPLLHLCTTKAIDQYHNADVDDDDIGWDRKETTIEDQGWGSLSRIKDQDQIQVSAA